MTRDDQIIVVTGATGRQGGAVARHLRAEVGGCGCNAFTGLERGAGARRCRCGGGPGRHGRPRRDPGACTVSSASRTP